jgi:hypothetical protein
MNRAGLGTALLIATVSCAPTDDNQAAPASIAETEGLVEVIARDLELVAPDTIPSGWTTFRFTNTAPMIHFAVVERFPEGMGIEEHQQSIAPLFQEGFALLSAGQTDAALARFGELPPWFGEIVFMGGPGLTAPGHTSEASVYLQPGTYLLECYVKTDGVFHAYNPDPAMYGMVHEFTVTDAASDATEPAASLRLTISSEDGIVVEGDVVPGEHTVAVDFVDQMVHENFVGHDVHLVRLTDETDLDALDRWMDWTTPTGLMSPAPAEFLGGTNEMPAGTTSFFTVTLEPGDYAWIAEVSRAADKGMLVRFTVPAGAGP